MHRDRKRSQHIRLIWSRLFWCALLMIPLISGCEGETGVDTMLPPQCVPGRVKSCPCIGGTQGVQECSLDGRRYLTCQCKGGTTRARSTPFSSSPKSKTRTLPHLKSSTLEAMNRSRGSTSRGQPTLRVGSLEPPKKTSKYKKKTNKVYSASKKQSRYSSKSAPPSRSTVQKQYKSSAPPKRGLTHSGTSSQEWWFISEVLEKCVIANDVNGIDYSPSHMLGNGCYIKSQTLDRMLINCNDPPLGPRVFNYTKSEALCWSDLGISPKKSKTTSSYPPASSKRASKSSTTSSTRQSSLWSCMCYQERYRGSAVNATACRPTRSACLELEGKVSNGSSPVLIPKSTSVPCGKYKTKYPWSRFGKRTDWIPSSHQGSWWSPNGCLLKKSRISSKMKSASRSFKSSKSPRAYKSAKAPVRRTASSPSQTTKKEAEAIAREQRRQNEVNSCEATCWAHLATKDDLKKRFETERVPKHLTWGKTFADRVDFIMRTCVAKQLGRGQDPLRGRQCFKEGVKSCQRFCERSKKN